MKIESGKNATVYSNSNWQKRSRNSEWNKTIFGGCLKLKLSGWLRRSFRKSVEITPG